MPKTEVSLKRNSGLSPIAIFYCNFPGGTAFRASAGYGRHGVYEDSFFELAGKLPETLEFFAEADRIDALIKQVGEAGLKLVYVTHPVATGMTGA